MGYQDITEAAVRELLDQGWPPSRIAGHYGVTNRALAAWCRRRGIELVRRGLFPRVCTQP